MTRLIYFLKQFPSIALLTSSTSGSSGGLPSWNLLRFTRTRPKIPQKPNWTSSKTSIFIFVKHSEIFAVVTFTSAVRLVAAESCGCGCVCGCACSFGCCSFCRRSRSRRLSRSRNLLFILKTQDIDADADARNRFSYVRLVAADAILICSYFNFMNL